MSSRWTSTGSSDAWRVPPDLSLSRRNLVQVVRPVAVTAGVPVSFPAGYDERLTELCRQEAQDYLNDLAERLREDGVRASAAAVVSEGVAGTILDLTRSDQVGLVALATHGRGGLQRLTL